jgi:hypothetical protein
MHNTGEIIQEATSLPVEECIIVVDSLLPEVHKQTDSGKVADFDRETTTMGQIKMDL